MWRTPTLLALAGLLAPGLAAAEPKPKPKPEATCPDVGRYLILMTDQEPGAGTYLVDTVTGRVWLPYVVPLRKADVVQLVELERVDLGTKAWKKARKRGWPLGQDWVDGEDGGPAVVPNPVRGTRDCIDKCVRHPKHGVPWCEKFCAGAAGLAR